MPTQDGTRADGRHGKQELHDRNLAMGAVRCGKREILAETRRIAGIPPLSAAIDDTAGRVSNRMSTGRFRKPGARLHSCLAHPGPRHFPVPPCAWFRLGVRNLDRARLISTRLFQPVFKVMILG